MLQERLLAILERKDHWAWPWFARLPESEGCDPTPDYEQADQSWDE